MTAFDNAYEFTLSNVMYVLGERETVTGEDIYTQAEADLRDWDAFAGARSAEEYELTDSQWDDCLYAVCETVEARLEDKLVDS